MTRSSNRSGFEWSRSSLLMLRLPYGISMPICQQIDSDTGSDSLAEIFDKLQLGVLEVKENDDEHWMRKVWLATVEGQPTLDI